MNDVRVDGPDPFELDGAPSALGPMARLAFADASDSLYCGYGIPQSDGIFYLIVLTLGAETASELVAALDASDEYQRTRRGDISLFSKFVDDGIGTHLGYAFDGTVWAIVEGTMVGPTTSVNLAADAVAAVLG